MQEDAWVRDGGKAGQTVLNDDRRRLSGFVACV
jgi:hypothetical protein